MGGSADLAPSTKTLIDSEEGFSKKTAGRNLHFGVREHAMGAIANGMALCGLRPYAATFLVFSDYMRPAIRLAALMHLPVLYVFTHDSIGLGEDGPTHQPVEHLDALRAIPNLEVIRPADANELAELWKHILSVKDHPIALALTRQNIPTLDRSKYAGAELARRGAYVLDGNTKNARALILASGSEVEPVLKAQEQLQSEGIETAVISMPSMELFEQQDEEYKKSVLPDRVSARVAVEAGTKNSWYRYVGSKGKVIGMNDFGASAPYKQLMKEYGFSRENIIETIKILLKA